VSQQTEEARPSDPTAGEGFERDRGAQSLPAALRDYVNRVRGGDLGALPSVFGFIALCLLFTALRPDTFPSAINFANLLVQSAPIVLLALGLVFVLLVGEIDLSAGVAAGVCAAVLAKILSETGAPVYFALLGAILTGVVIGATTGALVALIRIPSFVATLALFLGWQGVTLWLIGQGGTVPVNNEVVAAMLNGNIPVAIGWVLCALTVLGLAAVWLGGWRRQQTRGLARQPFTLVVAKVVVVGGILVLTTAVLSMNRAPTDLIVIAGIPYAVPLMLVLIVLCTFVLQKTSFGRHIYAVGGNAEAARRAGINVTRVRLAAFVICSTMAAVTGVALASRLGSVSPATGGGETLLYAVGAAVVGGTSLFGGRGRARNALLGGLVIAVIANGLGLLLVEAYVNFVVTGLVLLLAGGVDALARRRAAATGH
jgi:ABC-type xylose transport system permease subunit